jgi:hypothetical protein
MENTSGLTTGYPPALAAQIAKTKPGMAHFAATGPFGATCGDCVHLGYWRQVRNKAGDTVGTKHVGGCAKFFALTGKHGSVVPASTEACRYFERKEEQS